MKKINLKLIKTFSFFLLATKIFCTNLTAINLPYKPVSIIYDANYNLELVLNPLCKNFTPTLTYAKVPHFNQSILHNDFCNIEDTIKQIGVNTIENIINEIIEKETELQDSHFVFYHGQKREFILIQDLYTKLFENLNKTKLDDFIFIRIPACEFNKFKNVESFKNYYKNQMLYNAYPYNFFDNDTTINKHILSVNLSLFGNSLFTFNRYHLSECTFKFFLRSANITTLNFFNCCKEIFSFLNLSKHFLKYKNKLKKLIELLATNEYNKTGNLLQIFIPKNIISDIVYRSTRGGIYYYWKNYITEKSAFDDLNYYSNKLLSVANIYYDFPATKHTKLDEMQFRILITNDKMLNPKSGVKVFRYFNETENTKLYQKKLNNLLNVIEKEINKSVGGWKQKLKNFYFTLPFTKSINKRNK